jgi:quercetin 2,3-dioxygenase
MNPIKAVYPLGFPWKTQDPFLFCVHHEDSYPAGNDVLGPDASLAGRNLGQDFTPNKAGWRMYHGRHVPGFPAHPHFGFETVTIVTEGLVDHSDSLGAAGRFGYGDVQWMTAGKGVQHCEMFPLLHQDRDNPLELFQIWLNLPQNKKGANPYFAMLWSDTIPTFEHRDNNHNLVSIRVIAGSIGNAEAPAPAPDSWAANGNNEVAIWTIKMEPGAIWALPASKKEVNRSLFFYKGSSIEVAGLTIDTAQAIELHSSIEVELKNGNTEAYLLLLQGKPINEQVVQHGPFVVNSAAEVQKVMNEYRKTQFGGWPWPSYENVHAREKGRFAKYPDGKEESRPL